MDVATLVFAAVAAVAAIIAAWPYLTFGRIP
jgi:hypothetical protein